MEAVPVLALLAWRDRLLCRRHVVKGQEVRIKKAEFKTVSVNATHSNDSLKSASEAIV